MSTAVAVPETEDHLLVEECRALVVALDNSITVITDDTSYQSVCMRLKNASANIKAIEEHLEPMIEARHKAHKRLTELRARLTSPHQEIKTRDSRLVGTYQADQQRRALEETRRQQAEADKKAAEERSAQAEQLATEGRVEEGVAMLEQTEVIPEPVYVAPSTPKVSGISAPRYTYSVELLDFKALVKAVAEGKALIGLLTFNQSAANNLAKVEKDNFSVPGCKVHKTASSSTSG